MTMNGLPTRASKELTEMFKKENSDLPDNFEIRTSVTFFTPENFTLQKKVFCVMHGITYSLCTINPEVHQDIRAIQGNEVAEQQRISEIRESLNGLLRRIKDGEL